MNEHIEVEARWIGLEQNDIEKRLKKAGAQKTGDYFFKEWILALPEWEKDHRRIRVRTDGKQTWLTYKANATWEIDSTEEVEVTVDSAENAVRLLEAAGIPVVRYQEKKRIQYKLGEATFELDFWPKIPMVLEIEAPSEEKIKQAAERIGLSWDDVIFEDQKIVHEKYFDVDLDVITHYAFEDSD